MALRNEAMASLTLPGAGRHGIRWLSAVATVSFLAGVCLHPPALAETGVFQQAINYVFTGKIDPQDAPEIVDEKSCVVVMRDPKYKRYIRYYLSRFKMDVAMFDKDYAGSRVSYQLKVKGDDIVIEYLDLDKKTVLQGYRSAQIPLRGDIDQTRKALHIIFADHCKAEKPKTPF
jgi:hypothetical protein